jgi:tetratricopeptide (TPR) repeat protein
LVWLADFEGPPSDPALAATARELVAGALDQSRTLAAVPREQVRIALHNSGRPDSIAVPPDLARELAFRSAIPVVLEGRIGKLGSRYSIVLRATNARDASVIQTANGDAQSESDLVPELTRLARVIRQGLGEHPDAFRETASWADSPTPSFEAFKLALQGRDLNNANDPQAAVVAFRRALEIDPEFASAWIGIGTVYGNMAFDDSALVALERALRIPARLTPARRLDAEAKIASIRDDVQGQIDAYDELLRLDPSPSERALALNNKAVALSEIGLHAQALELYRKALGAWPVQAPPLNVGNVIDQLVALNRVDEARSELSRLTGPRAEAMTMTFLAIDGDWDRLDSLATARLANPSTRTSPRRIARNARVAVLAVRGSMEKASQQLSEMAVEAEREADPNYIGMIWTYRDWMARLMGRASPPLPTSILGTPWGWAGRASHAALAGDSNRVQHALRQWPATFKPRSRALVAEHVAGTLAWKLGRWQSAVDHLRGHARGGIRSQPSVEELSRAVSRWMIADCFVRLQQPDSAAAYLELLITPPQNPAGLISSRGIWSPYARSRLVALYAGRGRIDEAERQWEILSATCTRPDPAISAMLDETRATLQTARGMRAARP